MAKDILSERKYFYTCIVYPDSAPANWVNTLMDLHMDICISPLHDSDIVEETGEVKKPHYHVVFLYDSLKSRSQAISDFMICGGVYPPPPDDPLHSDMVSWAKLFDLVCGVRSKRGMLRYLCHLDNPDKHQYNPDDVVALSGFDYHDAISCASDGTDLISEICDWCQLNNVISFSRVVHYARLFKPYWLKSLSAYAYFYKTFLQSADWSSKPPID